MTNNENQINHSFDKRRICIKDCRDILLMSVKNREIAVEAAARQWLQKNPGKEGYIELVRASAECDVMRKKYKVPTMDPVKRQCQIDNLSIWERIIITAQSRSSSNKKATKCRANRKKKKFHAIVVGASLTSSSTSTTSQSSSSVLKFYQKHGPQMPVLETIIAAMLGQTNAQVDPERLFSIGKHVISDLRCALLPGRAEALILSAARYKWSMFGNSAPTIPDVGVDLSDLKKIALDDALEADAAAGAELNELVAAVTAMANADVDGFMGDADVGDL